MKVILLFWLNLALTVCLSTASSILSKRDVVGVSSDGKFNNLLNKALSGFRSVILLGDEKLGYPIMDPYTANNNLSWSYTNDEFGIDLQLTSTGAVRLNGLSEFMHSSVTGDLKKLVFEVMMYFFKLEFEIPYKIEGTFFKKIVPVYGEGTARVVFKNVDPIVNIKLFIEKSIIGINKISTNCSFLSDNIQIDAPGLMNLPPEFASFVIHLVIEDLKRKFPEEYLQKLVANLMEKTFVGKTMEEFIDYLNYLADLAE